MRLARILMITVIVPLVACFSCSWWDKDNTAQGPQGWSQDQKVAWYTASQGSRLIPQSWLHALERSDSATPFLDQANIARYRYLPSPAAGWKSPDAGCPYDTALPLGFTVDCQSDKDLGVTKLRWKAGQSDQEPWVGMNCSACHTNVIDYKGKSVLVDGAPTLADFQSFTEDLEAALKAAGSDDAKFAAFSAKVLGPQPAPGDADMLRASVKQLVDWNDKLDSLNAAPIRYGYGRLDAIGHIFNKVALIAMPDDAANQTANPSDAPVSYPFLWNISQLDKVEWDGVVANVPFQGPAGVYDVGALGRNTGEVIGVFGDVTVTSNPQLDGYKTSVSVTTLAHMEEQLRTLQPPVWPKDFPAIDPVLAKEGADLFKSQHCDSCHAIPTAKFTVSDKYTVVLSPVFSSNPAADHPVGTDIWMACNAIFDQAKTGRFQGTPLTVVKGTPLGETADNLGLLQTAAVGSILGKKWQVASSAFDGIFGLDRGLPLPKLTGFAGVSPKDLRRNQCMSAMMTPNDPKGTQVVYKGRPLQGIWATAPYLHNGSVPTLYDLLLPPAQRPATFYVGAREFDPVKVGFVTAQSEQNSFRFDTRDAAGKPIDGNSNEGHDYDNAALTDEQRKALVEYMKSL